MNDLQELKRLSLLERLGLFYNKHQKVVFGVFIAFLIFVIGNRMLTITIARNEVVSAEDYITQAQKHMQTIHSNLEGLSDYLSDNAGHFKAYAAYKSQLSEKYKTYQNLEIRLDDFDKDLKKKNTENILYNFEDKGNRKVRFPDEISLLEKDLESFKLEIEDIVKLDSYLITESSTLSDDQAAIVEKVNSRHEKLLIIQSKGKTKVVKNKAKAYFDQIDSNLLKFKNSMVTIKPYTIYDQGSLTLDELKRLQQSYTSQRTLLDNIDGSIKNFDNYWNELQEQYYTVVIDQFVEKSIDYVEEANSEYSEWNETEYYESTEYYTEEVYVGSRIVGDKQQDIYERVTKERPVTKSRTVRKDNGKPKRISVPYDVYSYYYTVEKYTSLGSNEDNILAGSKHEKYDNAIKKWQYSFNQAVGYIRWKVKWDDNEGIVEGMNLNPKLE